MPGIISPTLLRAICLNRFADSLSKWLGSIQPKSDVPPMGHMTILFLISTFPIFQGVNNAEYFSSIKFLLIPIPCGIPVTIILILPPLAVNTRTEI